MQNMQRIFKSTDIQVLCFCRQNLGTFDTFPYISFPHFHHPLCKQLSSEESRSEVDRFLPINLEVSTGWLMAKMSTNVKTPRQCINQYLCCLSTESDQLQTLHDFLHRLQADFHA